MSDRSSAGSRPGPFHGSQQSRGARFVEVGGFLSPEFFDDGGAGRRAARTGAGIVDLSPGGRIKITGSDRKDLLQRISASDLRPLEAGGFAPIVFVTPKGRIVDRALLLDRGDSLLLVTSPAGRARLAAWIRKYVLASDVALTDVTEETAAFALTGPAAAELVKAIAGVGVSRLEAARFLSVPVGDVDTAIAPYDAMPSAWIFLAETPGVLEVHERALAAGAAPIGLRDAEVLRVEAGIPADGHELTEDWNPWEARLEGSFSLQKGCYTGQEVLARLNTYDKIQKRLVGLRLGQGVPPAIPARVVRREADEGQEREAGTLTSAVVSDRLGETIGLAFVKLAWEAEGTELLAGDEQRRAVVTGLPFR